MFSARVKKIVTISVATLGLSVLLPGCFLNPNARDNNLATAQFSSDESANMSADAGEIMTSGSLSKSATTVADTNYINWIINPYKYDLASGSFIRTGSFATSGGYTRMRVDTVTFYDAQDAKIALPTLENVARLTHIRHVTHTRGGEEANVIFTMNSVLTKTATVTTLVKNGNIKGTYDGEVFATGVVTNVTRKLLDHKWQYPETGTISATFPNKTFTIQYLGNGTAQATLTNLKTDKVTVVTISVDER